MKIERCLVKDLSQSEIAKLLKLTLPGGSMGPRLQQLYWLKNRNRLNFTEEGYLRNSYTLRAFDEIGNLLGWALIEGGRESSFRVFIDKSCRRRGIAKTLLEEATKEDAKLIVLPWNSSSYKFFKPFIKTGKVVCSEQALFRG